MADKTKKFALKKAIEDLGALLGKTPVIKDDPLESFSLFHLIVTVPRYGGHLD